MKKGLQIFLATILLLGVVSCGKKADDTKKPDTTSNDIQDVVEDKTKTTQGDLEFSNIKIDSQGAINVVTAKVKNTGSKTLSFKAVLYMKNSDKRTLGKVDQQIDNLVAGKTADINVQIMGDYTTVNTFEVVVEDLK